MIEHTILSRQNPISWIRRKLEEERALFPKKVRLRADHYLKRRLMILPDEGKSVIFDPSLGKPVPYATFWFADALDLRDANAVKRLALGLLYVSLYTTITDDLNDQRNATRPEDRMLANFYLDQYVRVFQRLFPAESRFGRYLSEGRKETMRYELWRAAKAGKRSIRPLSARFLRESSRYFVGVVLPTLAGVALLSGREDAVPSIRRFLRHFSMGWRIFDDMNDWEKDIVVSSQNHSSFLGHIFTRTGRTPTREVVLSGFLSPDLVKDVYQALLAHFESARIEVLEFRNIYLDEFMNEQIGFHVAKRDELLRSGSILRDHLTARLLGSVNPA